jgi:hypothetical protein
MSQQVEPLFDENGNIIGYKPAPIIDPAQRPIPGDPRNASLQQAAALSPSEYLEMLRQHALHSCGADRGQPATFTEY